MFSKIEQMIKPGIHAFLRFNRGVLGLPLRWQVWVVTLVAANIVTPLFFLGHVEAQITLAAGAFGLAFMSYLTARFGFSRVVGLGHVAWLPLLAFLGSRLSDVPPSDAFGLWLRVVITLDATSLAFDTWDVLRFVRGERAETVSTHLVPQG